MAQRLVVDDGRLEQVASSLSLAELGRLDELTRGASAPAVSAIWLDETREGVALRIVDLRTGRILLADNLDSRLAQQAASRERVTQAQEYERRSRGDALVHLFDDFGLLPQQHISFDFLEQWGPDNCNLSGFSLSLIDPLLGLGASYFRVIPPAFNLMVGAKLLVSLPNALVSVFAQNGLPPQFAGDGTFNGVFMVRVPLFKTNYGLMASVSTNGRVTVGLSLLNSSLLGLLP